jgi:acyl-CoA synthetase (AMP-forming)/AMP-acid ligase II
VPDDQFGERIVAVASFAVGQQLEEEAIITFTKEHLAGYKAPRHLVIVKEVPRAPNGKPDHKTAKQQALTELEIA